MPGFFSYLPNVYVGEGVADDEATKYRLVKNLFRRTKTRDDLSKYSSLFEAYSITAGQTPSSLALDVYKDAHLDWVILLVNNITDVYEDWPRNEEDLITYVNEKYSGPDDVHHYETQEILLDDIVYMPGGIVVNRTWRTVMPDGTTKNETESVYPVSNYEYESFENEKKRQILLPVSQMVDLIIEEFEQLIAYAPHLELDDQGNKKTPISIASRFLGDVGYITSESLISTDTTTTTTSFDYGPGSSLAGTAGTTTATSTVTPASGGTTAATTTSTPTPSPSPSPSPSPGYGGGY